MNYNITLLTILMVTALLLCGSASATTLNSTNTTINVTTNKLVSATPYPDLVVKTITAPSTGVKGKTIIVANSIKNQGNAAAKGFYVSYYIKKTSSSTAYYIGQRYIKSLAAGATNTQNTQLTIPTTIPIASYYIMVYADYTKLIKESNESNNHNYSTTKINILFTGRPVYITSDNIDKYTSNDIARINNIVSGLQSLGLYAVNYGIGPDQHDNILFNTTIPKNALIVDIYGGVCAGTIWDMTQNWYKYYLGNRSVFSIWINTTININNITFLQRAHDDNFTPLYGTPGGFPNFLDTNHDGIFEPGAGYNNQTKIIYPQNFTEEDGILNPGALMKKNGYSYLYQENGDIQTIINAIYNYLMSI
jgi:hypothetical protein